MQPQPPKLPMDQNHMLRQSTEPVRDSARASSGQTSLPPLSPPAYAQTPDGTSSSSAHSSRDVLPPIQHSAQHEMSLPSLSAVTGSGMYRDGPSTEPLQQPSPSHSTPPEQSQPEEQKQQQSPAAAATSAPPTPAQHWPSMNPFCQYYKPSYLQENSPATSSMDVDSPSESSRTVSLDDPDVRMAAEALGDLRADFVSSPPRKHSNLPSRGRTPQSQQEPLLSLLTVAHPSIATTLEGATTMYLTGKNYSPRFKSGAEYVEGFVAPVASTVGNVGRAAGVEGGLRWYLKRAARGRRMRFTKDSESEACKRRKVGKDGAALPGSDKMYGSDHDRRNSTATIETLPAYDDVRSPEYTEVAHPSESAEGQDERGIQTRVLMTTSGLSVAMSEQSLKNLKYCLQYLRTANGHIGRVIEKLKAALEQYDAKLDGAAALEEGQADQERSKIVQRITDLKDDIVRTLRDVIKTVSTYAGGALPENARDLVRRQLISLPRRFSLAQQEQEKDAAALAGANGKPPTTAEKAFHDGAQRVLVLAREGLEMMSQVSNVLDGTIASAEDWCERLGKKISPGSSSMPAPSPDTTKPHGKDLEAQAPVAASPQQDVDMSG